MLPIMRPRPLPRLITRHRGFPVLPLFMFSSHLATTESSSPSWNAVHTPLSTAGPYNKGRRPSSPLPATQNTQHQTECSPKRGVSRSLPSVSLADATVDGAYRHHLCARRRHPDTPVSHANRTQRTQTMRKLLPTSNTPNLRLNTTGNNMKMLPSWFSAPRIRPRPSWSSASTSTLFPFCASCTF
jgi:hypothetical protein